MNICDEKYAAMTMKDIPQEERPYEKCEEQGAARLSDAELLAIILRTGSRGEKSIDMAYRLLSLDSRHPGLEGLVRAGREKLREISGIGRVKSLQLEAVIELAGRISRISYSKGSPMNSPEIVAEFYMSSMRDLKREELHLMYLDTAGCLIAEECQTVGTHNASLIDPRSIFISALRHHASSVILIHNHPSGNVTPSPQDIGATERVRESGRLLGIELLDHLIIGNMKYTSLRQSGYI